jgi:hypothetical protein
VAASIPAYFPTSGRALKTTNKTDCELKLVKSKANTQSTPSAVLISSEMNILTTHFISKKEK